MKLLFIILIGSFTVSCGTVMPVSRSERAVIAWSRLGYKFCLEPTNSAESGSSRMIVGYANPPDGPPNYGVTESNSGSGVGRATAEKMLVARELLYRACEARRNGDLSPEVQKVIFLGVLGVLNDTNTEPSPDAPPPAVPAPSAHATMWTTVPR